MERVDGRIYIVDVCKYVRACIHLAITCIRLHGNKIGLWIRKSISIWTTVKGRSRAYIIVKDWIDAGGATWR